jgi:hypothetical protein
VRPFQYSRWDRVLPVESIVVAALSDRRDLSLARRRATNRVEPTRPRVSRPVTENLDDDAG